MKLPSIQHSSPTTSHKHTPYLAGLLVILGNSALYVFSREATSVYLYISALFNFILELGPIVLLLSVYRPNTIFFKSLFRGGVLIGGPFILHIISQEFSPDIEIVSSFINYILVWVIYGTEYINEWLQARQRKVFKFKPNLDNSLFLIVIITSFASALLLNSYPDAIHNQPIPFAIDIQHNLANIPMFFFFWVQMFLIYMCPYALYYLNHHVLINHYLNKQGVVAYIFASFTALLILYPLLSYFIVSLPVSGGTAPLTPSGDDNIFSIQNFNMGFAIFAASLPLILTFKWQENSRQLSEAEKGQLQAELILLQQQINPHFLFNSLNSLYALTLTKSSKAPEAVLQLSGLFRYVVYKGDKDRVPLADEYAYLQDYLALQRLRMGEDCQFNINIAKAASGLSITPLMLIVFIENAFKHGLETNNKQSWLNVTATTNGSQFTFICENSILRTETDKEQGIGLENVRKRLNLQYKDQHSLTIENHLDRFCVSLIMDL